MENTAQKIEALLFYVGEAVAIQELARILDLPIETVRQSIVELESSLDGRGLCLTKTNTHVQLVTSPLVREFIAQYAEAEASTISPAAAETLSLVAYKGPISRQEIEAIRGVDCRRMIRQLRSRGLIRISRSQDPITAYEVTEEFLQHLGLARIEDLPRYSDLSSNERIEQLLSQL